MRSYTTVSHTKLKAITVILILFLCVLLFYACAVSAPAVKTPAVTSSPEAKPTSSAMSTPTPALSPTPAPAPSETPPPVMLSNLEPLFKQNSDLIGWLTIEGTKIDYPVMYSPQDHDFYLYHNFEKKADKNGLLVLQADCDPFKPSTNLIIHAHKMKSGKMFGTLAKYKDKAYYQQHPLIKFDTLYTRGEYAVFAVFLSKVYKPNDDVFKYYRFINADTQAQFDDYLSNIKQLSIYDTGVDVRFGDNLITLSTCNYHTKDGRFVVVAKKVK